MRQMLNKQNVPCCGINIKNVCLILMSLNRDATISLRRHENQLRMYLLSKKNKNIADVYCLAAYICSAGSLLGILTESNSVSTPTGKEERERGAKSV
jgi:hypothetical protein